MAETAYTSMHIEIDADYNAKVFFKDRSGRPGAWLKLSEDEARRQFMAALDVIDPDGLELKYSRPESEGQEQQARIIEALARGAAGSEQIAATLDLPVDEVLGRVMKLRNQGLITKIDSKGRAGAVWSLSATGFAAWRSGSRAPSPSGKRAA